MATGKVIVDQARRRKGEQTAIKKVEVMVRQGPWQKEGDNGMPLNFCGPWPTPSTIAVVPRGRWGVVVCERHFGGDGVNAVVVRVAGLCDRENEADQIAAGVMRQFAEEAVESEDQDDQAQRE